MPYVVGTIIGFYLQNMNKEQTFSKLLTTAKFCDKLKKIEIHAGKIPFSGSVLLTAISGSGVVTRCRLYH